jgi:hypothetical protein
MRVENASTMAICLVPSHTEKMRLSNIKKTAITAVPYLGLCSEKVRKITNVCAEQINVDFAIKNA